MLQTLTGSLVGDQLVGTPGKQRELINPAIGEAFHSVADATHADLDRAAEISNAAWKNGWRDLAPAARSKLLHRLANLIEENADVLAELDSQSMGKPIASARGEVLAGAQTFRYYAGALSFPNGDVIPVGRGGFDFTIRQPLGVVACIVPWNFPFPIASWKVAPALAAGNCVLLKPAQQTPLGALALGQLALEAGFPAGVLQVICGSGSVIGDALVTNVHVRKISFTGSTAIGRRIMELAARDFKRISLELGGKSPNIVFADADWEKAADASPMSVFDNTGQDCCARSRIFVERSIYPAFLERFVAATQKLKVGDPQSADTEIGPLVSEDRRTAVEQFVSDAKQQKSRILLGGEKPDAKGYFFPPTVIADVEPDDLCWREEIFGPVACVRAFDSEAQAITEANASPYGLSGSVWTKDITRALRVAREIESGVISVNCHNSVHTEAPFGGWKHSGMGRDLGLAALEGFTELKNVYIAG